jgi:hypothetical protein
MPATQRGSKSRNTYIHFGSLARRQHQDIAARYPTLNGGSARTGFSSEAQSTSNAATPLIRTLDTSHPGKYRKREKESKEESDK